MTRLELQRIEHALGVKLPAEYRQVMLDYPFAEDSFANDCELPNDADRVIGTNRDLRETGFFGRPWPEHFFSFGGDGSGNEYFLDLSRTPAPVFLADHESAENEALSSDFHSWLEERKREYHDWEEEDRRRAERRKHKRWWQFWV